VQKLSKFFSGIEAFRGKKHKTLDKEQKINKSRVKRHVIVYTVLPWRRWKIDKNITYWAMDVSSTL
jgi:hypothetical protein